MTSSEIKTHLQRGWIQVTFTKKDGTSREMLCTTNLDNIPLDFHPTKQTAPDAPEPEDPDFKVEENPIITVYEFGKGWRSFRLNSLTKIVIELRKDDPDN